MRLHLNWGKKKPAMAAKDNSEGRKKADTTSYLLGDTLNKERLLRAVADLKNEKRNIQERTLIEK
jgi:hypothetical protein